MTTDNLTVSIEVTVDHNIVTMLNNICNLLLDKSIKV